MRCNPTIPNGNGNARIADLTRLLKWIFSRKNVISACGGDFFYSEFFSTNLRFKLSPFSRYTVIALEEKFIKNKHTKHSKNTEYRINNYSCFKR